MPRYHRSFRFDITMFLGAVITSLITLIVLTTVAASDNDQVTSSVPLNHALFADSLTGALYSTASASGNECSSSLGVSMAFSLVYPAAEGKSEEQIRDVLTYPSNSQSLGLVWRDTASRLVDANQGVCLKQYGRQCNIVQPIFKIANRVFVDNSINLSETYSKSVGEYVEQLDFSNEDTGAEINSWVSESTNGLIDSIVEDGPLGDDSILVAINSIYLKASWAEKFKTRSTNEDLFYTSPSRNTILEKAHFMHQVSSLDYSDQALPGFQILKLPFAGSESLSMILVLPFEEDKQKTLAASEDVLRVLPLLKNTMVAVGIPKFEFESKYEGELKEALKSLGVVSPFEGGMCIENENCGAFIDKVIQKTYIGIDEDGVEAAAVTAISMLKAIGRLPGNSILFLADHPMQFFIHDEEEDLVLFEGRVGNPGIPEGVSGATLMASHKDDGFWKTNFYTDVTLPDSSTNSDSLQLENAKGSETTSVGETNDKAATVEKTAANSDLSMEEEKTAANSGSFQLGSAEGDETTSVGETKEKAILVLEQNKSAASNILHKSAMLMFSLVLSALLL